jgi:Zn-dependent M28 family amino/carboxypeptidase
MPTPQYLRHIVQVLSQVQPPRNYKHRASLEFVSEFIADELKGMGYTAKNQDFMVFEHGKNEGKKYQNVLAHYTPPKPFVKGKKLIVGAHYDVFGEFPGADDNASAVAGLLGVAKMLAKNRPKLDFEVEFVAFSLEEPPYFGTECMGSSVHARILSEKNEKIIGMINFEMIGYYSEKPDSQDFPIGFLKWFYPSTGNFIALASNIKSLFLAKKIRKGFEKAANLPNVLFAAPSIFPFLDWSDHRNYWKEGFPAIMITDTSFLRNKNYHTEKDTWDTLDYEKMLEVVKGTYAGILEL